MTTDVPRSAWVRLPHWIWGGSAESFLKAAGLIVVEQQTEDDSNLSRVETKERSVSGRPGLVTSREVAGPGTPHDRFDLLEAAERLTDQSPLDDVQRQRQLDAAIADMTRRIGERAPSDDLTPLFALRQLETIAVAPAGLVEAVETIYTDLGLMTSTESDEPIFPDAGIHLVTRDLALIRRAQLPAVMLRIEHDPTLAAADTSLIASINAAGQLVFAGSSGLNEGVMLLDTYLSPLMRALTPFVWAIPTTRASGTIVYTLGCALPGVRGEAAEPLQLMPGRSATEQIERPDLSGGACSAALQWWTRRLDRLLSVTSDPATFTDTDDRYVPNKHLHALLTIDQVFRRTGSILQAHRDIDARRVLLFTVLDSLQKLTSRDLLTMCRLTFATRTLRDLEAEIPAAAHPVLMPAARRAVAALQHVQDGFFLQKQLGTDYVTFVESDGTVAQLPPDEAAAEYIRVLRNATHGHGANREENKPRTDALLANHDGRLHDDLGLLGYLYLLELMGKPDLIRRTLYCGGQV